MKSLAISLALLASFGMEACGSNDQAPPPPLAAATDQSTGTANSPPASTRPAAARHGGTVVVAGDYPVEVVTHATGEVYAHILSPTPPPGKLEIRVQLPVANRAPQDLILQWNAGLACYEGRVRDVVIAPGPIVVHVISGPQVWIGRATTIVIAPAVVVEMHHWKHKKHKKHKKHGRH